MNMRVFLINIMAISSVFFVGFGLGVLAKTYNTDMRQPLMREEYVADYLEERLVEDYTEAMKNTDCKVYNSDELTREILEHRNGKIIIERCIGEVTNATTGDGKVLNAADEEYNYISYKGVNLGINNGTRIVTFLCYNPDTNGVDDILDRYDYILTRDYE